MEYTPDTAPDAIAGASFDGSLRIYVMRGPDEGRALRLSEGQVVTIGMSRSCDFVLRDQKASRRHASIRVLPTCVEVEDMGSKNGTFYMGARINKLRVPPNAILRIGETEICIQDITVDDRSLYPNDQLHDLWGKSVVMRQVFRTIQKVARSDATVLISGETGCGKELVARALHELSPRRGRPYVVAAMNALSISLVESELFGFVRGAFTGANATRQGLFEQAQDGTLFLDEIGELPLEKQPSLLRALEAREIRRVGDTVSRPISSRFVAATNRDLRDEVREGRFREDLLYRLTVAEVVVPPLRDRPEDIVFYAERFLQKSGAVNRLPDATKAALMAYSWPGNVRQLRNVLERAVALSEPGAPLEASALGISDESDSQRSRAASINFEVPFREAKDLLVMRWEREYLDALMRRADGNVTKAAQIGGMHRVHLHKLLRRHGVAG